jgi:hypothetical protein
MPSRWRAVDATLTCVKMEDDACHKLVNLRRYPFLLNSQQFYEPIFMVQLVEQLPN